MEEGSASLQLKLRSPFLTILFMNVELLFIGIVLKSDLYPPLFTSLFQILLRILVAIKVVKVVFIKMLNPRH
jgi:hypothetical protein